MVDMVVERALRSQWGMPFKSKAQRRKFAELMVKGEISPETFEEWNRDTGSAKLPERVARKEPKKKATSTRKQPAKKVAASRKKTTRKKAPAARKRAPSKRAKKRRTAKRGK
jgi:hypothetical protein